jgi:hypothetical protein
MESSSFVKKPLSPEPAAVSEAMVATGSIGATAGWAANAGLEVACGQQQNT